MSRKDELLALAERVEALTGPDREVDWAVVTAIGKADFYLQYAKAPLKYRELVPAYTASLDAAMSLVPEGWRLGSLNERAKRVKSYSQWKAELWRGKHQTHVRVRGWSRSALTDPKNGAALALTAAALRALA